MNVGGDFAIVNVEQHYRCFHFSTFRIGEELSPPTKGPKGKGRLMHADRFPVKGVDPASRYSNSNSIKTQLLGKCCECPCLGFVLVLRLRLLTVCVVFLITLVLLVIILLLLV